VLERASKQDPKCGPAISTSLSCFLHIVRLRIIESSIQQSIYRVDKPMSTSSTDIDHFIAQLSEWKTQIPRDNSKKSAESSAFDGYDYYVSHATQKLRRLGLT
jgi:hypothetical protein